ncbi:MAG: hypothetical protein AVDCRST_MAG34-2995 [uncultured Nocardioidaceae bacterium]|uniref:Uncharacterized protein n=1 Tax=uncultured Nocardioidaceae bacterium TaxID=253824 RepID=A0A6J4MTQ1_9ACTN|nr:MAG: hypothetical protein AVDCRST_MAG34-2995 [uncultured Nocardioidaceae bacterium]
MKAAGRRSSAPEVEGVVLPGAGQGPRRSVDDTKSGRPEAEQTGPMRSAYAVSRLEVAS